LHGNGVGIDLQSAEHYLFRASSQGYLPAKLQYGICLFSGMFGKFDFVESQNQLEAASSSSRFARVLRDALLAVDEQHLMTSDEFFGMVNVFSVIRSGKIPIIRIINAHMSCFDVDQSRLLKTWIDMVQSSIHFLLDLSQARSTELGVLSTQLGSCRSVDEIVHLILKIYSTDSGLYRNINFFLRCFPIQFAGKFMKELGGILNYIYLLQSSIEFRSRSQELGENVVVYRGLQSDGPYIFSLYESMIGKVVVLPGFTSTSRSRDYVIDRFVKPLRGDGVLFEITLHSGDRAADITFDSAFFVESEVLIAACSGFLVVDVARTEIEVPVSVSDSRFCLMPVVKLDYVLSWFDFDIDTPPPRVII
jgi:hypothetical protein